MVGNHKISVSRIFLVTTFLVIGYLPSATGFDTGFLQSDSDQGLIKVSCKSTKAEKCKVSEVWTRDSNALQQALATELPLLLRIRIDDPNPKKAIRFLKEKPSSFKRAIDLECKHSLSDIEKQRDSFHKGFNTFFKKVKSLQSGLCHAKSPEQYLEMRKKKEALSNQICEMHYFEYPVRFISQGDNFLTGLQSRSAGIPKCYFGERLSILKPPKKDRIILDLRKRKPAIAQRTVSEIGGLKALDEQRRLEEKECQTLPEKRRITFTPKSKAKKKDCQFLVNAQGSPP